MSADRTHGTPPPAADAAFDILVADDDLFSLALVRDFLEDHGHRVVGAEDGESAWDILRGENPPQIAILDWMMPGYSGVELCRKIRERENGYTYVILLTSKGEPKDSVEGLTSGADDYLVKPFEPEALLSRLVAGIRVVTSARRMETRLAERERALRETVRRHEHLIASIPSLLVTIDGEGIIRRINEPAWRTLGLAEGECVGRTLADLDLEWDYDQIREGTDRCRAEKRPVHLRQVGFRKADDTQGFLELTINPLLREAGADDGFLLLGKDITRKKLIEQRLAQAERLESTGQLAAGIAHEINTPTQFIGGNLEFIKSAMQDLAPYFDAVQELTRADAGEPASADLLDKVRRSARTADLDYVREEVPKALDQAREGVEKVTKIVNAMKAFSNPSRGDLQLIDIHRALEGILTVTRSAWKKTAEVRRDFDRSLPRIMCYPAEINQVVAMMIINAVHAIEEHNALGEGRGIIELITGQSDGWLRIAIRDTGCGMPEEVRRRVFDPFFTTRDVGQGTGQGLAICHDVIAKKHRGRIEVESTVGEGSTFTISLPIQGLEQTREDAGVGEDILI